MAALDLATIPSDINTYERLLVWCGMSMQSAANGDSANVIEGAGASPVAQVQTLITADGVPRFVVSAFIPVDQAALADPANQVWMAANDLTQAAPHTNFLSN